MSPFEAVLLFTYFLVLLILGVFGAHRYAMVYLYVKHQAKKALPKPLPEGSAAPVVTVQLPVFNEMYVVRRLIESVCAMRYPKDRLEIQVLDDSTDETTAIAAAAVEHFRAEGFDIRLIHRADRSGFKAGALQNGLHAARGEFVAVFDADFIAPEDFLEGTLGHFEDPKVGMVQARWEHLNRSFSLLTQLQSILLDGHFVLEHGGRNRGGRFFNFNGTAGVWRRATIEDAGSWEHDTLTEDLDLSYRAQLRGWRFVFVPDLVSPAELPVDINAFKSQQARWAKGSAQVCLKLLPRILRSPLPLAVKTEAAFHLTGNLAYPLMVALSLLMFPALVIRYNMGYVEMLLIDVPLFLGATMSVCSFYSVSQRELFGERFGERLKYIPATLALGIGLSVSNARAVLEGFFGQSGEFVRTPKLGVLGENGDPKSEGWKLRRYRVSIPWAPWVELALGIYFAAMAAFAFANGLFGSLPFVLIFTTGYLYAGILSLVQEFDSPPPARTIEA
jgi:cellulose synthase/poly-beta-1,6-N-acetylglucosamine synthase-like glycosyltransferase